VTVNGGMAMRAWYDIVSLDAEGRADENGIRESSRILDELVARELERGIDERRIVIAGFSQGGAVALHNVLQSTRPFAGLMALSSYLALPSASTADTAARERNAALPVFMAHGSVDPMVPISGGRDAADTLQSLGYPVEWREYPMAHGVCPQEIADISEWLLSVYAPSACDRADATSNSD
jgi:phospholipase/carboxylesterase